MTQLAPVSRPTSAPPPSPATQSPTQITDTHVVVAWNSRQLSDGTPLNLGRINAEQGFIVTPEGTAAILVTRAGRQVCADGSERLATSLNLSAIRPHAGGHTHPQGRSGDVSGLPGPEDGRMAAATDRPAYVISQRGAFAIEAQGGSYSVRQLAGAPLSATERGEIARLISSWNQNGGGSGVRCTFIPNR
jgi:hypothetical protein